MNPSPDFLRSLTERFPQVIPHVRALGIELQRADAEAAQARLPPRPEFVGDPERGLLHTGVITTLIDSVSGVAVFARLGAPEAIVTLDLRVDYLRASPADSALICRAVCYRLTPHIAFVRARVWQRHEDEPVAESLSTFMRAGAGRGPLERRR